jgi:hypothetical protein
MKIGDRVMKSDVDERSIPAYRALRGTVIAVSKDGRLCRVEWGRNDADVFPRRVETVMVIKEGTS